MVISPISILGGESVYCINEAQMRDAQRLAHDDPESSERIQSQLKEIENNLSRNETY
jgi:trans-2-enoyl-CoA reductase